MWITFPQRESEAVMTKLGKYKGRTKPADVGYENSSCIRKCRGSAVVHRSR